MSKEVVVAYFKPLSDHFRSASKKHKHILPTFCPQWTSYSAW